MAVHARNSLTRFDISRGLDPGVTAPAFEASSAESLIISDNSRFFDLFVAYNTDIRAAGAHQSTMIEEKKFSVSAKGGKACVATEAARVPHVSSSLKGFSFPQNSSTTFA